MTCRPDPLKGWLLFCPSKSPRWWNRFLHPEYQHVSVLIDKGYYQILIEPGDEGLQVETAEEFNLTGYECVPFCNKYNHGLFVKVPFGAITCVEIAKYVAGVKDRSILTPYQLKTHVEKHHGKTCREFR